MCGICGIFSGHDIGLIKKILELQHRRGPDATGTWGGNGIILGHNRLSIIDISANGNQPMETDKGVIVFNGEIFNYIELKKCLEKQNVKFNSESDTEVLLRAIDNWGIDKALDVCIGQFSFGYYRKDTDELILVRDRLGLKPLYYTAYNGSLIFASNLAAIIKSIDKKWILNREVVYKYLLFGGCPEGETIVRDIYKLESATYMVKSRTGLKKVKYWTPKPSPHPIPRILENSIEMRKRSDVPISILFSGGIDSSIIGYHCPGYKAVHLCTDETEYAVKIAKKLELDLQIIEETEWGIDDMEKLLDQYIDFSGEPSLSALIPMIALNKLKKFSTVGLSGNGGDELFYGYDRTPYSVRKPKASALNTVSIRLEPKDAYKFEEYQLVHMFRHPENFEVYGVDRTKLEEIKKMVKPLNGFNDEARYRWFELDTYVRNELNPVLDFASTFYSTEIRLPFLDHRVVESALTLTSEEHISPNDNFPQDRKIILKKILKNKLDANLFDRTKRGFSLPTSLNANYNSLGENSIERLKKRKIIKSADFKFGYVGRDQIYFQKLCYGLEKWLRIFVDSGLVTDTFTEKENDAIMAKYRETNRLTLTDKINIYTGYRISLKIRNVGEPDALTLNGHRLTDIVKEDDRYSFYFANMNSESLTVNLVNSSKTKNRSIRIIDFNVQVSKEMTQVLHLILFSHYANQDRSIADHNNIADKKLVLSIRGVKTDDSTSLFGFKRHGLLSWKIVEKPGERLGLISSMNRIDGEPHCIFVAGHVPDSNRCAIYFYVNDGEKNLIWKTMPLKKQLTFLSTVVKIPQVRYGLLINKIYPDVSDSMLVNKICHFPIDKNVRIRFKQPDRFYKVVVIIAFTGRYEIMEKNVKLLTRQTMADMAIILIGSTEKDCQFMNSFRYKNVFTIQAPNNPCGAKWQVGTFYARLFNPEAVVILGSDDLLSLDYLRITHSYISRGYDLVGKREWSIVRYRDPNRYQLQYTDKVKMSLGAGRVYSKKILDKMDWFLFEFLRDRCLDDLGHYGVARFGGKILDCKDDIHVVSVKGDWEQYNSFEKIVKAARTDNPTIRLVQHRNVDGWMVKYFGEKL